MDEATLGVVVSCVIGLITVILLVIYFSITRKDKHEKSEAIEVNTSKMDSVSRPVSNIPFGMKECFQCKTIIRADCLTCPQCGKDPSKLVAIGGLFTQLGAHLTLMPLYFIILVISGICLWSLLFS